MNNTFSAFRIETAPSQEELKALSDKLEAPKTLPPAAVNPGSKGRMVLNADGSSRFEQLGTQRVETAHRHPGRVTIGGIETSREAAIAAGLLNEDGTPTDGQSPSGDKGKVLPTNNPPTTDNANEEGERELSPETADAVGKASAALNEIAGVHGPSAVEAHLWDAAGTGEVPVNLPDGVTPEQVQTIWDGYRASAEHYLSAVGSSVRALEEMMSDDELAQARKAIVMRDHQHLSKLGREATRRLETLPTDNPEKFKEVLAMMAPEHRAWIRQNAQGEWLFWPPNDPETLAKGFPITSWGNAVRQGYLKF